VNGWDVCASRAIRKFYLDRSSHQANWWGWDGLSTGSVIALGRRHQLKGKNAAIVQALRRVMLTGTKRSGNLSGVN